MNAFMVLTVTVFGFYVLLTSSSSSSSGYSDEPFGANRIQTIGIRRTVELVVLCRRVVYAALAFE